MLLALHRHTNDETPSRFDLALKGINKRSLASLYKAYHGGHDVELDLNPPMYNNDKEFTISYRKPGEDFKKMGKECTNVMGIAVESCLQYNICPLRMNWEYVLLKEMGITTPRNHDDSEYRKLAMLTCLILSAATTDQKCITVTVELHKAGMLDLDKLNEISIPELATYLEPCGINSKKAKFLKDMASSILNKHGGIIPCDLVRLKSINGVARKTAVLMLNEAFGFFAGIGTDIHIVNLCLAFQLLLDITPAVYVGPAHAEAALRTWTPEHEFKRLNKVFGSFAQLFTQEYLTIKEKSIADHMRTDRLIGALLEYIHKPFHVELLWFMIKTARSYYKKKRESDIEF